MPSVTRRAKPTKAEQRPLDLMKQKALRPSEGSAGERQVVTHPKIK